MPSAEFEPAIPATKQPQTYSLDRAATGICFIITLHFLNFTIITINILTGYMDFVDVKKK
jgi:hypothetical protein